MPPPVLLVPVGKVAPAHEALRREADLVAPDFEGDVVGRVRGRRQSLGRDPEVTGQELPAPVDGLALEVVAEAPVTEHLEEGVMARRATDLLEVVVLAGDTQAALVVDRTRVAAALLPSEDVLELDHAAVREQQRLIAGRDEARARHDRVSTFGEELDEALPKLRRRPRHDPGVRGDGWGRHRPQWYRTEGGHPCNTAATSACSRP
jgi:hypothetical protein